MLKLLTRLVAVTLLAAAPLISSRTAEAQTRSAWPVYPSLYYSYQSCNVANNYVVCQPGGIMESQINSGYECNEIDIVMTGYNAGPVDITMSADDQSLSQTMTIDGNGTYYTQFPGFLVNNLVALEFSLPDGASFSLPTIYSAPCPVATSTPTAAPTNTANPSDTATSTVNPSYTVTPIPTHTPLPSGHSTFTPTSTPTAAPRSTPTPTAAGGATEIDCGDWTFPLLNCNLVPLSLTNDTVVNHWTVIANSHASPAGYVEDGANRGLGTNAQTFWHWQASAPRADLSSDTVKAQATGELYADYSVAGYGSNYAFSVGMQVTSSGGFQYMCGGTGRITPCSGTLDLGPVAAGSNYQMSYSSCNASSCSTAFDVLVTLSRVYVVAPGGSPTWTPTPATTPSSTPSPLGPSSTPTPTLPPDPFATDTPAPTDTPCPSGCAVAQLTSVPGISTMITVDTSPLSALDHLSLSRSSCTPFGYVQIPYPVITGTPALGQPLNFGWTVPVTHTWDNTNPITNTAIQPCAMNSIPSYLWDTTYWGSVLAIAVVFFIWLIGFVGRLSGDHTING